MAVMREHLAGHVHLVLPELIHIRAQMIHGFPFRSVQKYSGGR